MNQIQSYIKSINKLLVNTKYPIINPKLMENPIEKINNDIEFLFKLETLFALFDKQGYRNEKRELKGIINKKNTTKIRGEITELIEDLRKTLVKVQPVFEQLQRELKINELKIMQIQPYIETIKSKWNRIKNEPNNNSKKVIITKEIDYIIKKVLETKKKDVEVQRNDVLRLVNLSEVNEKLKIIEQLNAMELNNLNKNKLNEYKKQLLELKVKILELQFENTKNYKQKIKGEKVYKEIIELKTEIENFGNDELNKNVKRVLKLYIEHDEEILIAKMEKILHSQKKNSIIREGLQGKTNYSKENWPSKIDKDVKVLQNQMQKTIAIMNKDFKNNLNSSKLKKYMNNNTITKYKILRELRRKLKQYEEKHNKKTPIGLKSIEDLRDIMNQMGKIEKHLQTNKNKQMNIRFNDLFRQFIKLEIDSLINKIDNILNGKRVNNLFTITRTNLNTSTNERILSNTIDKEIRNITENMKKLKKVSETRNNLAESTSYMDKYINMTQPDINLYKKLREFRRKKNIHTGKIGKEKNKEFKGSVSELKKIKNILKELDALILDSNSIQNVVLREKLQTNVKEIQTYYKKMYTKGVKHYAIKLPEEFENILAKKTWQKGILGQNRISKIKEDIKFIQQEYNSENIRKEITNNNNKGIPNRLNTLQKMEQNNIESYKKVKIYENKFNDFNKQTKYSLKNLKYMKFAIFELGEKIKKDEGKGLKRNNDVKNLKIKFKELYRKALESEINKRLKQQQNGINKFPTMMNRMSKDPVSNKHKKIQLELNTMNQMMKMYKNQINDKKNI